MTTLALLSDDTLCDTYASCAIPHVSTYSDESVIYHLQSMSTIRHYASTTVSKGRSNKILIWSGMARVRSHQQYLQSGDGLAVEWCA